LRAARWLSLVFQPFLTGLYLLVAVSILASPEPLAGLLWAAGLACLAVGLPALDLARRLGRRQVTDFQLALREQRLRPLLVALAGAAAALLVVLLFGGPPALAVTLVIALLCGGVLTGVTTIWKISFHAATLATGVLLLFWYGGYAALVPLALLPVVAWSRVKLGCHSPVQVVAGSVTGALVSAGALWLMAGLPLR
jgi:hypothetical protein